MITDDKMYFQKYRNTQKNLLNFFFPKRSRLKAKSIISDTINIARA